MKFKRTIVELIEARSSWRKYSKKEIAPNIRQDILAQISFIHTGPFKSQVEFQLVQKKARPQGEKLKLGTYGFISGATNFIAGAVKQEGLYYEDYGFVLEKLILYFTDLGLATCWLGGTLKRSEFGKAFDLADDEIIPAVTPIGYASSKRGMRDKLFRKLAGSRNRKPWPELFFSDHHLKPLTREAASEYAIPLDMVRLAPSASNHQPWRIIREENCHHFFLKRKKNYDKIIKSVDLQRIDMGIAMSHFELAASEMELKGKWQVISEINKPPEMEYLVSWIADSAKIFGQ